MRKPLRADSRRRRRRKALRGGSNDPSNDRAYFTDVITQQVFLHPVVAGDGKMYENTEIRKWIAQSLRRGADNRTYRSPITGVEISVDGAADLGLRPAPARFLHNLEAFVRAHPEYERYSEAAAATPDPLARLLYGAEPQNGRIERLLRGAPARKGGAPNAVSDTFRFDVAVGSNLARPQSDIYEVKFPIARPDYIWIHTTKQTLQFPQPVTVQQAVDAAERYLDTSLTEAFYDMFVRPYVRDAKGHDMTIHNFLFGDGDGDGDGDGIESIGHAALGGFNLMVPRIRRSPSTGQRRLILTVEDGTDIEYVDED